MVVVGIHRQESGVLSVCGTGDDDDVDGQVEQAEDAKQGIMLGEMAKFVWGAAKVGRVFF